MFRKPHHKAARPLKCSTWGHRRLPTPPPCRRPPKAAAAEAIDSADDMLNEMLLAWASAGLDSCPVGIVDLPSVGRGLVVLRDVEEGETLLSVPFSRLFMSPTEEELDTHWAAGMALRLLDERAKCKRQPPTQNVIRFNFNSSQP